MRVAGFWPEPGVGWTSARANRLNAELQRFAGLAGLALDQDSLESGFQSGSQKSFHGTRSQAASP